MYTYILYIFRFIQPLTPLPTHYKYCSHRHLHKRVTFVGSRRCCLLHRCLCATGACPSSTPPSSQSAGPSSTCSAAPPIRSLAPSATPRGGRWCFTLQVSDVTGVIVTSLVISLSRAVLNVAFRPLFFTYILKRCRHYLLCILICILNYPY